MAGWIGRLCALCALAGLAELTLPECGGRRAARLALSLLLTAQLVGALAAILPMQTSWDADAAIQAAVLSSDVDAERAGAEAQLLSLGRQACAVAVAAAEEVGFAQAGARAEMAQNGRVLRLTVRVGRSNGALEDAEALRMRVAAALGADEGVVRVEVAGGEGEEDGDVDSQTGGAAGNGVD